MNNKNIFSTLNTAYISMFAAIYVVLGICAIDFGNIKITFEAVPVIIGAFMFGPVCGGLIGGIGALLSQLLRYGFEPMTILWMLPYIVCGLYVGFVARKFNFNYKKKVVCACIIVSSEIIVFIINTVNLLIFSHIYKYGINFVVSALPIRFFLIVVKSILYSLIMPYVLIAIGKMIKRPAEIFDK